MKNLDFAEDMRKLFDGMNEDDKKTPDAKEHDEEERKDVSSEAESEKVAESADEGEGSETSHEKSPDEGDEGERREAVSEKEKEEDEDEIDPPKHWKKSDRDMFRSLPKESKEFLLNQSRHFQADYMRKVNDVKGLVEALDPMSEEMARGGLGKAEAVRHLVKMHLQMRDTPAEAMKQLFINYGVDPVDFVTKWDKVESLNEKLKEVNKKEMSDAEKQRIDKSRQKIVEGLNEWAKDKEYAEEVEPQMSAIFTSHAQAGKMPPHIDDIYEEACWANPKVRKIMMKKESLKTSIDEKKRTERSRKAASGSIQKETEGRTTDVGSGDMTRREEIALLMSKAG